MPTIRHSRTQFESNTSSRTKGEGGGNGGEVPAEVRIENMIISAHEWVQQFCAGYKKEKKLMRNINRIWEKMSFSLDGMDTNCRVKWNDATGLNPGSDGNWNGTAGFGVLPILIIKFFLIFSLKWKREDVYGQQILSSS